MKSYKYIIGLIMVSAIISSCEDDFLQRFPQTSITKENFFQSPKDLDTYVNGIYDEMLSNGVYDDINSDNTSSYSGSSDLYSMLRGNLSSANVKGWDDWDKLRGVNFMLNNAHTATGDPVEIKHYIGIARYFRAQFYLGKMATYSDVPWYNKAMETTDPDLYKASDPRALVADSILNDLEYAVANIKEIMGNKTRIHRYAALALMSRFCLYEGTYRKYHPEVNLTDSKKFLDKAVWACEQLMQSNNFEITGTSEVDYRNLFVSTKLDANKEIIQWADYNQELSRGNNSHSVMGWQWSLSRSLMESYLMKDGTPFTQVAGYDKKSFDQVFVGRDPRLAETIVYPGYSQYDDPESPYILKPSMGGYDQLKFYPRNPDLRLGWDMDYTALPIFRYAEVLLNYAEAKAELGTLTQDDVDNTINEIRNRVQMPALNMAVANSNIDPVLVAQYPNVDGSNKGVILEIRRERRVEMACEGRRFDDLNRWAAGKRFEDAQQGMYVSALGAMDVTGDGVPDIAILASPNDESPIAGLPENIRTNLSKYYLKAADGTNNNFYLTNGTSGFIAFSSDRDLGRKFIEPQYYYRPIPQTELVLNPQLKQPFGWK